MAAHSPRIHYRRARLLALVSPAGLLAAGLLPVLLPDWRWLFLALLLSVLLFPAFWIWTLLRYRRERRESPERVTATGPTLVLLFIALFLWSAGLGAGRLALGQIEAVSAELERG